MRTKIFKSENKFRPKRNIFERNLYIRGVESVCHYEVIKIFLLLFDVGMTRFTNCN